MRRRSRRPASRSFPADALFPVLRLVAFLIILALVYSSIRNPQLWRWLETNPESTARAPADDRTAGQIAAAPASASTAEPPTAGPPSANHAAASHATVSHPTVSHPTAALAETIVPGPTDRDPSEAASVRGLFEAVTDRAPLSKIEMPAYWRCLKWARAQSFAELDRRALHRVVYTQLWEEPDKYRGKLIRLRLHLRRILDWEAPENSAGVRRVYEAWGWTDDSKSFPYVVVFSDAPAGIPLGDNIQAEGLFVGYFLKTIAYTAYNKNRSSPLLLGRIEWLPSAAPAPPLVGRNDWLWIGAVGIPVVLLIGVGTWFRMRLFRRTKLPAAGPADEAEMENWFRNGSDSATGDDKPFEGPAG